MKISQENYNALKETLAEVKNELSRPTKDKTMTPAILAIAIIITGFAAGLHNDATGCQRGHHYHRAATDRVGPQGTPEDWPNNGPGVHDRPQNCPDQDDNTDDFYSIGA